MPSAQPSSPLAHSSPESGPPPLEDRITFLVHTVAARIAAVGNRHFRAHDLNHYSARILVLLLQHEELRAGELVDMLALPQSTISSQLQALHAKRLIRRRRSRLDTRTVILTLTPAGLELARDCDGLSLRVHHALLNEMSAREKNAGIAFLRKVNASLLDLQSQEIHPFHGPAQLERLADAQAQSNPAGKKDKKSKTR
jgi:MarR family transcriptional regulator, organic hydroperoxide resistance regulator